MRANVVAVLRAVPLLSLLMLGLAASVQAQDTMTIKHAQGETLVPKQPKTVAVLDWSTLDTLAALGVEAQGIPQSNILPPMLEQYADARFEIGRAHV